MRMSNARVFWKPLLSIGAVAVLLAVFATVIRAWHSGWGAWTDEAQATLPGDEIVPRAVEQETRAISIRAPAGDVWFYVAQLGYDRAGFYSYELLEDVFGEDIDGAPIVFPKRMQWELGDTLELSRAEAKLGGRAQATLAVHEPGRVLGFAVRRRGTSREAPPDESWTFIIKPLDEETTRLIVRGRAAKPSTTLGAAVDRLLIEPIHFAMERKMMNGIKFRAEGGKVPELAEAIQVLLWGIVFASLVAGLVMTIRRWRWGRPLALFTAAAVVFIAFTLLQPHLAITGLGALLVMAAAFMLAATPV
jgi:hypothetical protein